MAPQYLGWVGRDAGYVSANNGGAHAWERRLDVSVRWVMPWEVRGSEDQAAIELPLCDPVTTEAFGPRWCLASEVEALYERHNTPTPRLWSGRVKT